MRKLLTVSLAGLALLFLAALAWSLIASNVETPEYEVLASDGDVEIRQYDAMIVAEASVEGDRDEAIGRGFRIIADYIFGNNLANEDVAMTAPVTQQASENIAMTAPVTQQPAGEVWKVRFVMPAKYTMDTLPKPANPEVELIEVPSRKVAAIRFSGFAGDSALERRSNELSAFLAREGLSPREAPVFAFYNDPWTLPFLRRNEVMVEIAD